MDSKLINTILDAGREAACEKMSLDRNAKKPDMRTLDFFCLISYLWGEVEELHDEIDKADIPNLSSIRDKNPLTLPEELLNAIRKEAGDVIAFASGIVAKCDQTLQQIFNRSIPSLFDDEL